MTTNKAEREKLEEHFNDLLWELASLVDNPSVSVMAKFREAHTAHVRCVEAAECQATKI